MIEAVLTEDTTCYRHPDIRAAVGCQRCERPICPACMNQASIGHHCAECTSSSSQQVYTPRNMPKNRPPVVVGLMAISIAAYVLQQSATSAYENGVLWGPFVADGEWWRIITSGFLHGGLLHVGFNMYLLWIIGQTLEEQLGKVRFGLVYLAGLLGGSLAVLAFNFGQPTLGASGAVLGMAGALAAVLWARGINIMQTSLGGLLALNLALPLLIPRISFWGHLGGILAGFAAGWLISWLPQRYGQSQQVAIGSVVALCGALALAAVGIANAGGLA